MDNRNQVDGHFFVCKLCGDRHEVPAKYTPYWNGQTYCLPAVGEIGLCCAVRLGTAQYSAGDFKAYRLAA